METDLNIRFHAYASATEVLVREGSHLYADALTGSAAASSAASASIICSHARELPSESELRNAARDAAADIPDTAGIDGETAAPLASGSNKETRLPLHPGENSLANLVLGASGIPAIKSRNG